MKKQLTLAAALLSASICTQAQDVTDPALLEAFEELRAMGRVINPDTGKIFAELHKTTDKGNLEVTKDVAYGSDPKNVMDVYRPRGATGTRPAVVFIHGGGLTAGDKNNPFTDLMNANVATYFGRHDMVGINATYRLAPNVKYPAGADDMQAIVAWIRENAAEYGIDPEQIFFLCSSAGCTHVASLLFDPAHMFESDPDIAGAIMMSGAYGAQVEAYFGADTEARATQSAMYMAEHYEGPDVPVFLLSAELDPHGIELGTAQLYTLLCTKRDTCPRFAQARDHSHLSINQHINTADDRYTNQMVDFIREVVGE